MRISANATLGAGRWRLIDIFTGGVQYNIDSLILSATQNNPTWEIYIDKDINALAQPLQPSLAATTTGGTIPRNTPIYVIITTMDANGIEGPPSDNYKTITTGSSTDTNKVTLTITAVTGAASYNIYAGTSAGAEAYLGNTASTSYVISALPVNGTLLSVSSFSQQLGILCPTSPDFFLYGHKDGTESISVVGGYPIAYRLIVYVTFPATGQPSFSALLG